jgi:hypothetical protein
MFKKSSEIIKVRSELNINNTLSEKKTGFQPPQDLVTRYSYHSTSKLNAQYMTCYNYSAKGKLLSSMNNKSSDNIKKDETNQLLLDVQNDTRKFVVKSKFIEIFRRAEDHHCIYDVLTQDQNTVTIIFLPISTSPKRISCGSQKFYKIQTYSNGLKTFYTTRLLFQKTMSKDTYNEWIIENANYEDKGDKNARKIIFNEIQKDLDTNKYSILKDTDIKDFNVEF